MLRPPFCNGVQNMSGNTRGKLKEEFEGMHRNLDWLQAHCTKALVLIQQHNPALSESINQLSSIVVELDKLVLGVYSKL